MSEEPHSRTGGLGIAPQLSVEKSFLCRRLRSWNGTGDQFLARAGLTQQEHGGIARGNHFHKLQDLA